jgi:hypothetical protein
MVGLSATDTGGSGVASTRYTTDGTDPTTSGSALTYTQPFSVGQTTTVRFTSVDKAGNQENAKSQSVQIDAAAPSSAITSPPNGSSVRRGTNVAITVSSSDPGTGSGTPSGVAKVAFYRDGNILLGSDASAPYSLTWSTKSLGFGTHTLTAVATDVAGNTTTSAKVTVTVTH